MLLEIDELINLEDNLKTELNTKLTEILTRLNRTGELETLLQLLNMEYLITSTNIPAPKKNGRILVIGEAEISENTIRCIGRDFGIEKDRFKCFLDFNDGKRFNFNQIQWNPNYSLIMVGPMDHSGSGKGEYSSIIAALEQEDGYPPVIRMGTNKLKITKSDFKNKLQEAIEKKIIA